MESVESLGLPPPLPLSPVEGGSSGWNGPGFMGIWPCCCETWSRSWVWRSRVLRNRLNGEMAADKVSVEKRLVMRIVRRIVRVYGSQSARNVVLERV